MHRTSHFFSLWNSFLLTVTNIKETIPKILITFFWKKIQSRKFSIEKQWIYIRIRRYLILLNKNPRFNNNPPFLSELFQILKTCLIITPPLVQKMLLIILIFFGLFLARIFKIIIHFLKRIIDYESRCLSQADDPSPFCFFIYRNSF